jgi:hypothetical protein
MSVCPENIDHNGIIQGMSQGFIHFKFKVGYGIFFFSATPVNQYKYSDSDQNWV